MTIRIVAETAKPVMDTASKLGLTRMQKRAGRELEWTLVIADCYLCVICMRSEFYIVCFFSLRLPDALIRLLPSKSSNLPEEYDSERPQDRD